MPKRDAQPSKETSQRRLEGQKTSHITSDMVVLKDVSLDKYLVIYSDEGLTKISVDSMHFMP